MCLILLQMDNGEVDEHEEMEIRRRLLRRHLTLPGMEQKAGEADVIMSFANHGETIALIYH